MGRHPRLVGRHPWRRPLRRSVRGKLGGINTLGNFAEINPRKAGGITTLENFAGGINTLEKSFGEINPPKPGGIKTLQALESNGETR